MKGYPRYIMAADRKDMPNDQALKDLEELASAAGKGLWSEPNPIPPWKWKPTKLANRH